MNTLRKTLMSVFLAAVAVLSPLAAASRAQAATVWQETETGTSTVQSTWTWDAANKRFEARYSNGAIARLRVEKLDSRNIVLTRSDPQGTLSGLTARYEGTKQGSSYRGTVVWTYKGRQARGTWESRLPTRGAPGQGRTFNTARFPAERSRLASPEQRRAFPRLGDNYEVLGPSTPYQQNQWIIIRQVGPITVRGQANGVVIYNCIAHTLGIHYGWVNPETGSSSNPLAMMDRMYGHLGYRRMKNLDYRLVPGKQKVVVYAELTPDGRIKQITHGALQEADGTWTSKLGALGLIKHLNPQALNGPVYGQPVAVYIRNRR